MFKKLFIVLISLFVMSSVAQARFETKISWQLLFDNVYTENQLLSSNIVVYKANKNISNYQIKWTCKVAYDFIERKGDTFIFYVQVKNSCLNPKIWLSEFNIVEKQSILDYRISSKSDLISKYTDYSDEDLASERLYNFWLRNSFGKKESKDFVTSLYNKFKSAEAGLKYDVIKYIIEGRKHKYVTWVKGVSLPTQRNRVPNTGRPYRSHYTDWIHHGWDFYSKYGDEVRAIDDGVIIRIKRNFKFKDLDAIKFGKLSDKDRAYNLDLLRGSQVWVKTLKWDVAIYSHLSAIRDDISVWDIVKKEQVLWKIWITWVPDRHYKDYHVHLELNKNPREPEKYWKYTIDDIMMWNYRLQWKTVTETMKAQYDIFE